MNRQELLEKARQCVCGEREQDYGSPEDNFNVIAELWNVYLGSKRHNSSMKEIDATDVSMMMALLKIARIRGNNATEDSFVDLAGYAACGAEIESNKKENN